MTVFKNDVPDKVTMDKNGANKRVIRLVRGFKSFQAARSILADIELMHMIRKGQCTMEGSETMSFADQFYALAGQGHPV